MGKMKEVFIKQQENWAYSIPLESYKMIFIDYKDKKYPRKRKREKRLLYIKKGAPY